MNYDGGSVKTTVGSVSGSANWGESSTSATLASDLATSLNAAANGAFTATVSGDTVTIKPAKGSPAPKIAVNVQDSKGFNPASFAAATQ
jgi:phage tail sheath gpL-like